MSDESESADHKKRSLLDELFANTSYKPWRVGLSCAASWAWGPSIAATLGIIFVIGWDAGIFWAIGNIFGLPVFIYIYTKFPELKYTFRLRGLLAFLVLIQFFAFWNNQQLIYELATNQQGNVELYNLMGEIQAVALAMGIAILAAAFIYLYGLPGSMTTDLGQYLFMLGGPLAISAIAILYYDVTPSMSHWAVAGGWGQFPTNPLDFIFYEASGWWWGIIGMVSYLGHPYVDSQQWQRIEQAPTIRTGLWMSLFFGAYLMSVVLMASILQPATEGLLTLTAILLVTGIAVASATLDSASAAMQRLTGNNKIALLFSAFAVITWPLVYEFGVVAIWGMYAVGRLIIFLVAFGFVIALRFTDSDIRDYAGWEEWDPINERGIFGDDTGAT